MLVDYVVIEIGYFNDYSDPVSHAKTMRGNGIASFIFIVSQCIIVNKTRFVTVTLIPAARLKLLHSRLGFKVIKDFATSPNFEEARKRFHYESGTYQCQ